MHAHALKWCSKKTRKGSLIILSLQNSRERKGIPRLGNLCLPAYNTHKGGQPRWASAHSCAVSRGRGGDKRKG